MVAADRVDEHRGVENVRVLDAGARNHVSDALPDLVKAVHAGPPAPLEQSFQLGRRSAGNQGRHGFKRNGDDARVNYRVDALSA